MQTCLGGREEEENKVLEIIDRDHRDKFGLERVLKLLSQIHLCEFS